MLIVLFSFEIIILGLTMLTTQMIENKLHKLQLGLSAYCNKRTYKTKSDIDFIETIITDYKKILFDTNELPDLESAIKIKLNSEYIGRFPYPAVKNIALKVKNLMWGIVVVELLITWINYAYLTGQAVVIVAASVLLTIITGLYTVIKGIDHKDEVLVDEVIHYVRNVYPLEEMRKQKPVEVNGFNTISLEEEKEKREELKRSIGLVEEDGQEGMKGKDLVYTNDADARGETSKAVKSLPELSARDIARFLDSL